MILPEGLPKGCRSLHAANADRTGSCGRDMQSPERTGTIAAAPLWKRMRQTGGRETAPPVLFPQEMPPVSANSRPMPLPRPPEASLLHSTFPLPIKILPSAKHRSRFIGNRFYRSGKPFLILRGICSPVLLKNDSLLIFSLINGK